MAKLLIVDDESNIRKMLKKFAEFEGHTVWEAGDGLQAVALCQIQAFDLIIMDVMMPGMDGFEACRKIRTFSQTPVIMLSARGEEYDRIHGFELGVDDYVVKPFSPKELMLRVQAVLKRGAVTEPEQKRDVVDIDGIHVDFTGRTVTIDGKEVEMSPKGYDLFFYMVRNRSIALTREKLIEDVWGYDFYGGDRTLDTHIKLLRRYLGPYSGRIVTLRGVGYRFDG